MAAGSGGAALAAGDVTPAGLTAWHPRARQNPSPDPDSTLAPAPGNRQAEGEPDTVARTIDETAL